MRVNIFLLIFSLLLLNTSLLANKDIDAVNAFYTISTTLDSDSKTKEEVLSLSKEFSFILKGFLDRNLLFVQKEIKNLPKESFYNIKKSGDFFYLKIDSVQYFKLFSRWLSISYENLDDRAYLLVFDKHIEYIQNKINLQSEFLSNLNKNALDHDLIKEVVENWIVKVPSNFYKSSCLKALEFQPILIGLIFNSRYDETGLTGDLIYNLEKYSFKGAFTQKLCYHILEILSADNFNIKDRLSFALIKVANKNNHILKALTDQQKSFILNFLLNDLKGDLKYSCFLSLLYSADQKLFIENFNNLLKKYLENYSTSNSFRKNTDYTPLNDLLFFLVANENSVSNENILLLERFILLDADLMSSKSLYNKFIALSILGEASPAKYKDIVNEWEYFDFSLNKPLPHQYYSFFLSLRNVKSENIKFDDINLSSPQSKYFETELAILGAKGLPEKLNYYRLLVSLDFRNEEETTSLLNMLKIDGKSIVELIKSKKYVINTLTKIIFSLQIENYMQEIYMNYEARFSKKIPMVWDDYFAVIFERNIYKEHQNAYLNYLKVTKDSDLDLIQWLIDSKRNEPIEITNKLFSLLTRTKNINLLKSIFNDKSLRLQIRNYFLSTKNKNLLTLGLKSGKIQNYFGSDNPYELVKVFFFLSVLDSVHIDEIDISPEYRYIQKILSK